MLNLAIYLASYLVGAAVDADTDEQRLDKAFREVPRPDVFTSFGFRVAAPSELEAPMTDDQAADLTAAERRDLDHHRPPRVGDVIFNWFD